MKTHNNNNEKSLLPLVCLFVVLVVIAAALLVMLLGQGFNQNAGNSAHPGKETTALQKENAGGNYAGEPTAPGNVADIQIETAYGVLCYPGQWAAFLQTETTYAQGCSVTFRAKLNVEGTERIQDLFRLTFDGVDEHYVGMLKLDDGGSVRVDLKIFEFVPDNSWNESQRNIIFSMQDALNHVLGCMNLNRTANPEEETTNPADERMAVDTPHGKLYYPARWEEYLIVEEEAEDPYTVTFCCKLDGHEAQPLFTVYFGGTQGTPVRSIVDSKGNTVEIRLQVVSFEPDDTWTRDERIIVYAMQEDMNVLLSNLI